MFKSIHTHFYFLGIIIAASMSMVDSKITFFSPPELQGIELHAYQFMFLGPTAKFHFEGVRVVASDPISGCHWGKIKNKDLWKDNIVVIDTLDGDCSPADLLRNADKGGALALIFLYPPGEYSTIAGSNFLDAGGLKKSGVEVHCDTSKHYDDISKYTKDSSYNVTVDLNGDPPNTHKDYYIIWSIVMGTFSIVNMALASQKLYQFIQERGKFEASLPQMCLIIEIIAALILLILCLEPDVGVGRGILDWNSVNFLQNMVWPAHWVSTLMIAFYWNRSVRGFGKSTNSSGTLNVLSLERWKIPLIAACFFLILMKFIVALLIALWLGSKLFAIIIFVINSLCAAAVATFFVVTGVRVLKWAKKTQSLTTQSQAFTRMNRFVICNSAALFSGAVFEMSLLLDWWSGYFLVMVSINFIGLFQILIFQPHTKFSNTSNLSSGVTKEAKIEMHSGSVDIETTSRSASVVV